MRLWRFHAKMELARRRQVRGRIVGLLSTRLCVRFPFGNSSHQAPTFAISARWRLSGDLLPIVTRATVVEAYRLVSNAGSRSSFAYSAAHGDLLLSLSLTGSSNPALSADIDGDGFDNLDGAVNPADFTTWRSALQSTTDLRADSSGDRVVKQADCTLRISHFGQTESHSASAVAATVEQAMASNLLRCQNSAAVSHDEQGVDSNFRSGSDSDRISARTRALAELDNWRRRDKPRSPQPFFNFPIGRKATFYFSERFDSATDRRPLLGDASFGSIECHRSGPGNVAVPGANSVLNHPLKSCERLMMTPLKRTMNATKKRVRTTHSHELRKISTRIPHWWR